MRVPRRQIRHHMLQALAHSNAVHLIRSSDPIPLPLVIHQIHWGSSPFSLAILPPPFGRTMARLNTRTSATPIGRASSIDSLYRDPTPHDRVTRDATPHQSPYSVASPVNPLGSDKENDFLSESRQASPQPHSRLSKPQQMPFRHSPRSRTSKSGPASTRNASKRRRTDNYEFTASDVDDAKVYQDHSEVDDAKVYQDHSEVADEDEDAKEQVEDAEMEDRDGSSNPSLTSDDEGEENGDEDEEEEELKYYNPDQNVDKRRALRISMRDSRREIEVNRDEYIKDDGSRMIAAINKQNNLMTKVRQTADATLDSRTLVDLTDMSGKQLGDKLQANAGIGIDIDQFLSRCIYYMKEHRPFGENDTEPTQTHRRRRTQTVNDENDEDEEEVEKNLDWAFLGRHACIPSTQFYFGSSFLLGPLSIEKKASNVQTRRARVQRQPLGPATRPQELRQEDIKQSENSNLTHLVKNINTRLREHLHVNAPKVETELSMLDNEPDQEDMFAAFNRHRVYMSPEDGEPAVSLFDFAVNPKSFGQTVENLFYVSFLIREGNAKVVVDEDGLPLLAPEKARNINEQRQGNVEKHQAIFSIDYPTWKNLVKAYDITEPLIPHRQQEEANIAPGGWYG
ncbi:unnamed protein product [Periconia digitata]|uniref:Non-structural maintenance of chromosomes element 4 n=1 Tax=Periconia digitata TaxID=1303443 RepID=A0A9W4ULM0_9PLEO|nr:unnamed protein product [Periconia digitata]